ncbi:MAG: hypothetical protein Q8L55_09975 [Phycisphaerales bacterium]|nr:hypothetical protein [Phycisphaerales bacterium]
MNFRPLLAAAIFPLLAISAGCIVHVNRHDNPHCHEFAGPVGNYAGAVRAAGTISFSGDRCSTLSTIAARADIDEASQLMLVDSLRGSWGFSGDKAAVLSTLVSNPACTPRSALHIANHLEKIVNFSEDRKRIADQLASRPTPQPVDSPR